MIRFSSIVFLLVAAGCGPSFSDNPDSPRTVADSAGVEITTNHHAIWDDASRWSTSDQPVVEIGSMDGDESTLFKRIGGALKLDNGTIIAADQTEVRMFDENGGFLKKHGRKGAGPGEYEYIRHIMSCQPEQFNVYDLHWQQSTYTNGGDYVDTRNVLPMGFSPYTLACTESGAFVSSLWAPQTRELTIGLYDTETNMVVSHPGGTVDTVMTLSGGQRLGHEHGSSPHPMGTRTSIATFGNRIYVSTGEAYEYRVYDLAGTLLKVVRTPSMDQTITGDELDAYALSEARARPPEQFDENLDLYRNIDMTDRFPAYRDMLIDARGNVWLNHHVRPLDETNRWDVVNAAGEFLGTMEFGKDLSIVQVGDDFVLGHRINAEGVPQVVALGLEVD